MSIWSKFVGNGGNAGVTNSNASGTFSIGSGAQTIATTKGYLTGTSNSYLTNGAYAYGFAGGLASSLIDKKYSDVVCENIIRKFLPILIHIQSGKKNINLICDIYLKIIEQLPDDNNSLEEAVERNKIIFELLNNGEATWVMYLRHKNDYISKLAELFIYHIKE